VPIADVNFLVGENSTGKTSILTLLNLLNSHWFWLETRFDVDGIELGSFNDIVSINAKKRDYFRIGMILEDEIRKEEGEAQYLAFLVTFINKEGLPIVKRISYVTMQKQIHVRFGNKTIQYKWEDLPSFSNESEFIQRVFLVWAELHREEDSGYRVLKKSEFPPFSLRRDLVYTMGIIMDLIGRREKRRVEKRFFVPRLFRRGITWLAPIRSKARRTYDKVMMEFSPEGAHTPYLIRKLLSGKDAKEFCKFIEQFGKTSRLFRSITVKHYGKPMASPFELDVTLEENPLNVETVGYGISQCLPIIVELFAEPAGTYFAIQQPEIHLHPKAQVALGELLASAAIKRKARLLIETHSDFTIEGFRLSYRKDPGKKKPDAQILFFERVRGENILHQIGISQRGELQQDQASKYREFFINHQMKILGI
jgi:hypothetical protein